MKAKRSFCCTVVESHIGPFDYYRRVIHPDGTIQWQGKNITNWLSVGDKLSDTLEDKYQNLDHEQEN